MLLIRTVTTAFNKTKPDTRFEEQEKQKGYVFIFYAHSSLCHCAVSVSITVFELLAHDGACRRGDIVCGVLLGIGRRDDGHQVVSVRWVHLKTRHRDYDWFQ